MIRIVWVAFAVAIAGCAAKPSGSDPDLSGQAITHAITPRQIVNDVLLATNRGNDGATSASLHRFKEEPEIRRLRSFLDKDLYDVILDFARVSKRAHIRANLSDNDQIWLGKYGEGNVFIDCIDLPEAIRIEERPTAESHEVILLGRYERDPGRIHSIVAVFRFVKVGDSWKLRDVDSSDQEIGGHLPQSSPSSLKQFLREATAQIRRMKPVPASSRA